MKWLTVIAAATTLSVGVCLTCRRLADRLTRQHDQQLVDSLIARARAKPVQGMELPDWQVIDRIGQRTWEETLQAQRRHRDQRADHARASLRRIA